MDPERLCCRWSLVWGFFPALQTRASFSFFFPFYEVIVWIYFPAWKGRGFIQQQNLPGSRAIMPSVLGRWHRLRTRLGAGDAPGSGVSAGAASCPPMERSRGRAGKSGNAQGSPWSTRGCTPIPGVVCWNRNCLELPGALLALPVPLQPPWAPPRPGTGTRIPWETGNAPTPLQPCADKPLTQQALHGIFPFSPFVPRSHRDLWPSRRLGEPWERVGCPGGAQGLPQDGISQGGHRF